MPSNGHFYSRDTGTVTISNEGGTEAQKDIGQLTVGRDATVILDFEDAQVSGNSMVTGTLEIGQNAQLSNLTVDGGTLKLLENTSAVHIENASFGSTLDTKNGVTAEVSVGDLTILMGGDHMRWMLDFDVANDSCDRINTVHFNNPGDKPLEILDYAILGEPTKEEYIFQILNITGGDPYPLINILNPSYETSSTIYELKNSGLLDGCIIIKVHPQYK